MDESASRISVGEVRACARRLSINSRLNSRATGSRPSLFPPQDEETAGSIFPRGEDAQVLGSIQENVQHSISRQRLSFEKVHTSPAASRSELTASWDRRDSSQSSISASRVAGGRRAQETARCMQTSTTWSGGLDLEDVKNIEEVDRGYAMQMLENLYRDHPPATFRASSREAMDAAECRGEQRRSLVYGEISFVALSSVLGRYGPVRKACAPSPGQAGTQPSPTTASQCRNAHSREPEDAAAPTGQPCSGSSPRDSIPDQGHPPLLPTGTAHAAATASGTGTAPPTRTALPTSTKMAKLPLPGTTSSPEASSAPFTGAGGAGAGATSPGTAQVILFGSSGGPPAQSTPASVAGTTPTLPPGTIQASPNIQASSPGAISSATLPETTSSAVLPGTASSPVSRPSGQLHLGDPVAPASRALPGSTFVDLGCGSGRAVFTAAFLHSGFSKAYGIEIVPAMHRATTELLALYDVELRPFLHPSKQAQLVAFCCGDFLQADWSDADVVLVNATCFGGPLFDQLVVRAAKLLKPGSIVISVSRSFSGPAWELLEAVERRMTWAPAVVYVQRRKVM